MNILRSILAKPIVCLKRKQKQKIWYVLTAEFPAVLFEKILKKTCNVLRFRLLL